MKRILLAGAAFAALTSASHAADLAAVETTDIWSGFFVGLQAGYGFGEGDSTGGDSFEDAEGPVGGIYFGSNWQWDNWILGVESSLSAADVESTDLGVDYSLTAFSTTRAKVGYAFDNTMIFDAAGGSIGFFEADGAGVDDEDTIVGWTVGGGVEHKFADSWSARVEALYIDYDDFGFEGGVGDFDTEVVVVRGGVAYHF